MNGATRIGVLFLRYDDWPDLAERVDRCEALGVDSVWIADHFVLPWDPPQPWLECWSLLAALATRTRRVRLGPLVTHAIYRNPAVLARTAMTIDRISGGRLELGMGTGASGHDWRMTGSGEPPPARERVDRFAEAVEIVDGLLRGTLDTYDGQYYRVSGADMQPGPVQEPRPRLIVAAGGPRMVRLAARWADAWVTEGSFPEVWAKSPSPAEILRLARDRAALLDEEAAALGRDPDSIGRVFLAGFAAGAEKPWSSMDAFQHIVGQFGEIGFTEFVFPEPTPNEWPVFEEAIETFAR